jgi:Protein of unknown function (DUF2752)
MKKRVYRTLILLSLTGYAWLGWNLVEGTAHASVPSVCLFKEATGLPCPSCGATRSLLFLFHGQVVAAFMTNPLGPLLALSVTIVPLWIAVDVARRKESFYRRYVWVEQLFIQSKWLTAVAVTVVVLNWIWNVTKGL